MITPKNPHIGGLFDDWLKAECLHEEVTKGLKIPSIEQLRADVRKGIESGPSKPWNKKKLKHAARARRLRAAKT